MTSKPFVPASIMGGSVLIEKEPFDSTYWLRAYRGIEILEHRGRGKDPASPPAYRHVVVYGCIGWSDEVDPRGFESVVSSLSAQVGGAAPRIWQAFGRGGRARVLVLEPIEGIPLARIVSSLRDRGQTMPTALALAIVVDLLPFVEALHPGLDFFAGLHDLILSPTGVVRARPMPTLEYQQCHSSATDDPIMDSGLAREIFAYDLPTLQDVALVHRKRAGVEPARQGDSRRPSSLVEHTEQPNIHIVGMMLRELLTGSFDCIAQSLPGIIALAVKGLPPILSARPDLPRPVATFVERASALAPGERLTSWRELRAGLSAVRALFDPIDRADLVALFESMPAELRLTFEPPHADALARWRELPHLGYEPVPMPARSRRARPSWQSDPEAASPARDCRPMLSHGELLVDVRPVTWGELARFRADGSGGAASSMLTKGGNDEPCTLMTFTEAEAYARWAGKRLPTEEEWTALVDALGAERLGVGEVWEWTSTTERGGHVVRGGRWRDAWERPPSPRNRSHETARASDVGFRCVLDRRAAPTR